MAHPLLEKAAESDTVASDGGLGVLILKGVTGTPAKKIRPIEQSSVCFDDFQGLRWRLFRRSGFPADDGALDESALNQHDATDSEKRSASQAEAENAALFRLVTIGPRPTWCCFVVFIASLFLRALGTFQQMARRSLHETSVNRNNHCGAALGTAAMTTGAMAAAVAIGGRAGKG
jgi:hypothetical protein